MIGIKPFRDWLRCPDCDEPVVGGFAAPNITADSAAAQTIPESHLTQPGGSSTLIATLASTLGFAPAVPMGAVLLSLLVDFGVTLVERGSQPDMGGWDWRARTRRGARAVKGRTPAEAALLAVLVDRLNEDGHVCGVAADGGCMMPRVCPQVREAAARAAGTLMELRRREGA